MSLPSVGVACWTFQSTQRPSSDESVRSVKRSGYCMSSGSQSTSMASMSARPSPPAASFVVRLVRASSDLAAFVCLTVTFGCSAVYAARSSSV